MANIGTRTGIRRPDSADLFRPYSVDFPTIADQLEAVMVRFRPVLAAAPVLEVGQLGQIRAGRPFTPADFTAQGLSAPLAIWNLSDVNDTSGNARHLTNKGAVPFGVGITGQATEAAIFAGSTGQALYRTDTGAADPFRIRTGSVGCWLRTAKRGVAQYAMTKSLAAGAGTDEWFMLSVSAGNVFQAVVGGIVAPVGTLDVADDRWHFVVLTVDGTKLRQYVDGALDGQSTGASAATSAGPLNIGGYGADASVATVSPFYGRVDAAFVTGDVLSDDQVRNLYCARIAHGLLNGAGAALTPNGARMAVRRRRRGRALVAGDFPAAPVRLHNFTAGALADEGSGGVALTSNAGTGAIVPVAGADGSAGNAYALSGAHTGLSSTDAGLPAALAARSYGTWLKTTGVANVGVMGWGTVNTADARLVITSAGALQASSAGDSAVSSGGYNDGLWHHVVVVEDNAAGDGVKRKLYLDGREVGGSTVLNTLTLAGANRFRIGALPDGTSPLVGQIDGAFVYAGALTGDQVRALYNAGGQQLAPSPKAEGDHVEAIDATNLLVAFDALEATDLVDLAVTV